MIPATSFRLDGDTALWVVQLGRQSAQDWVSPCDTCNGSGERHYDDAPPRLDGCPDCDGTGRHTFDIEVVGEMVEATHAAHGWTMAPPRRNLRVHVIDVLPLLDGAKILAEYPPDAFFWTEGEGWWLDSDYEPIVTLPPDAAPGKHLVRLAVHQ